MAVCIGVLGKVVGDLAESDFSDYNKISEAIRQYCGGAKNKENKFCFYIGALPESATSIINEVPSLISAFPTLKGLKTKMGMGMQVSKPLSYRKPVDKVCQNLIAKDAQICELKYGALSSPLGDGRRGGEEEREGGVADKPIDWKTIDLSKMRVKELKKILEEWGEHCKGCTEKSEYIRLITDLKPKHVKSEL